MKEPELYKIKPLYGREKPWKDAETARVGVFPCPDFFGALLIV